VPGPPPRTSTPPVAPSGGASTTVTPVSHPSPASVAWPARSPRTSARELVGPACTAFTLSLQVDPGVFKISDEEIQMVNRRSTGLAALDVSVCAQILNLLAALVGELRLTLVFISRDMAVIRHLCDEIVVLYRGNTELPVSMRRISQMTLPVPQRKESVN
jgi:hypothetical protein